MATPLKLKLPKRTPSPPPTPTKQGQINRELFQGLAEMKKMLQIMMTKSVGPDQVPSMEDPVAPNPTLNNDLYQHLQLDSQEQQALECEQVLEQTSQLQAQEAKQEELRKEKEAQEAEQLRLEKEREAHEAAAQRQKEQQALRIQREKQLQNNRAQQQKLMAVEERLCKELGRTTNKPITKESLWPEILIYLAWSALMIADFIMTSQSTSLDPEVQELLQPYVATPNLTNGQKEVPRLEEGELPPKTKVTDLTGKIPTTIVGTHDPPKTEHQKLASKVEVVSTKATIELERRTSKEKRHPTSHKRTRTHEEALSPRKTSKR